MLCLATLIPIQLFCTVADSTRARNNRSETTKSYESELLNVEIVGWVKPSRDPTSAGTGLGCWVARGLDPTYFATVSEFDRRIRPAPGTGVGSGK